jgi:hypothetical protein
VEFNGHRQESYQFTSTGAGAAAMAVKKKLVEKD